MIKKRDEKAADDPRGWVFFGIVVACSVLGSIVVLPYDQEIVAYVESVDFSAGWVAIRMASDIGDGLILCPLLLALVLFCREKRCALCGFVAMLSAGAVVQAIKHLFVRSRPFSDSEGAFPSGHTAAAFAAACIVACRFPRFAGLFYLAAAGVAASRVLLLRHYLSDVFAGAAIGLLTALAVLAITKDQVRELASTRLRIAAGVLMFGIGIYTLVDDRGPRVLHFILVPVLILAGAWKVAVLVRPQEESK